MKLMSKEKFDHDGIPVYAYGIEADSYEDAKAYAEALFDKDLATDMIEAMARKIVESASINFCTTEPDYGSYYYGEPIPNPF